MVRRRTASPSPSGPVHRASSPPPSRGGYTSAPPPRGPAPVPAATHAPPPNMGAAPSQGPGLMAQMAATAGGVAIGSAVGHAVGNMMTGGGGGGHSEAAQQQAAPQQYQPSASNYSQPCEFEWKQFVECSQTQTDVTLCQGLNEAFKQCRARNN